MNPLTRAILLVAVIAIPAVGAALVSADRSERPAKRYSGKLSNAAGGEVTFRVKYRNGVPKEARFRLRNTLPGCDDGSQERIDFEAVKARFFNRHEFRHDKYFLDDAFTTFYRVRGELIGSKSARGDVLFFQDPFDPPGTGNSPECNIRAQWRASAG